MSKKKEPNPDKPIPSHQTMTEGLAILHCLDMLNPSLTTEARGELIRILRELSHLRLQVDLLSAFHKDQEGRS